MIKHRLGSPLKHAADEHAIRDIEEREWPEAIAARDVERTISPYTDDASVLYPNQPIVTGKEAIRALYTGFLAHPGLSLTMRSVRVEVARSGELAYCRGTYITSIDSAGGKAVIDTGKYIAIYRKELGGKWRCIADISNSDQPAAAPVG